MDDVVGVKEVQAPGNIRQDFGAVFVPPKLALVVIAQSILEIPAYTSDHQNSSQRKQFQNITRPAVMYGSTSLMMTLRLSRCLQGGTSHKVGWQACCRGLTLAELHHQHQVVLRDASSQKLDQVPATYNCVRDSAQITSGLPGTAL